MTELQTELKDAAPYLKELLGKIAVLQFVGKHLENVTITIEVTFPDSDKVLLYQKLFPFNLEMELRCLIDDSIDDYQRRIKNIGHVTNL